ncbi:hypothetical protein HOY80DRAFT_997048 [Tuber brumale]|nr:hypothetical protein HOY80DRAFT_997048 [Tuber brumale]
MAPQRGSPRAQIRAPQRIGLRYSDAHMPSESFGMSPAKLHIWSDIDVRTWLLANPVADDPLDFLVYSERHPEDLMPQTPASEWYHYLNEEEYTRNEVARGTHRVAKWQVGILGMWPTKAIKFLVKALKLPAKVAKWLRLSEVDQTYGICQYPYPQRKCPTMSDDQDAIESESKRAHIEPSNEASQALRIEVKDIQNDAKEGNQDAGDIAAWSEPNTPNTPIPINMYRPRKVKLLRQAPVLVTMS